jgi:hypothetical protein
VGILCIKKMRKEQTFGAVVEALKEGKICLRLGWGNGFIFRQVPSEVPHEIIPRMTSLPPAVKDVLYPGSGLTFGSGWGSRLDRAPITYQNQVALVRPDNSIHGWSPSVEDIFASDWVIYGDHVVAGETVGAGTPLET